MHIYFIILLFIVYESASKSFSELFDSRFRAVGHRNIPLEYDCALRAFAVEMAAYIAPTSFKANWTLMTESAFQMNQCNSTSYDAYQPRTFTKSFKAVPEIPRGVCHHIIFVQDSKGNDLFDGTFERPMKTIPGAISLTRMLRPLYGSHSTMCMTIRGGTYYLGANATTTSSQIGAIALTSNDSNLIIENYPDENVILIGGV
ncbi:hypothetical protein I4U23_022852 [Adineta vaga]|nr:hypothetical protein I4U23_022852 [Adineta vaga]